MMQVKRSKYLRILLFGLGVIIILFIGLNWFVKRQVVGLIETALPKHITLNYKDLTISTLSRSLSMENVSIDLMDRITQKEVGKITIEDLKFKGFGVLDYLFNETLSLSYISVSNTQGYLNLSDSIAKDNASKFKAVPINKAIVNTLALEHLSFQLRDPKTDSVIGRIADVNLIVDNVNASLNPNMLSLSYDKYNIKTDSLSLVLGPLNTVRLKSIEGTNENTVLTATNLKTKYSPTELSKHVAHEKDYYDINIPKINATEIPKSLNLDDLSLNIGAVRVEKPNAFIYRDKLVADDLSIKPMLSEQLRTIPIPFHIKHFEILEAQLTYKERVHDYNDGGSLTIENSSITIDNLSNLTEYQPISMAIAAQLGGKGKVKANWEFDVLNDNDDFIFTADASDIDLTTINEFSQPNFNAEMEGQINQLYYTISGNKYNSHIGIKSNHAQIKIAVLDKSHKNRNKFFSSVANLMISKSSKTRKSDFTEVSANVERDMTKSGFNFIFKNVQKGMTKIFL